MIRLLIADDHELVRDGIRMTFEGTDVEIIAEARDGQEAFDELIRRNPDVALVDISMPGTDGFRLLALVAQAGVKIPIVMHSVHDGFARRCRDLGAKGFVVKGNGHEMLLEAVRTVHSGEEFWGTTNSP